MNYENPIYEKLFILICLIAICFGLVYGFKNPQYEQQIPVYQWTWIIESWENRTISTELNTTKPKERVNKYPIKPIVKNDNPKVQSTTGLSIRHLWFSTGDIKQQYVNYAYKLWGMDLVLLMECENGTWNIDTRWDNGNAYWLCQMNKIYNYIPEWYYDTRQIQVEYCAEKMKNWTPFYGPSRKIKWVKCYQYVKDRFYITNI